ncbi:MAG: ribonuclease H-like domain-containing protein [Lachnospiraceae bacterium]
MITVTKRLELPDTYPLERIGALTQLLFFDIETTGFSGDYSNLYLIGCTYYQDDCWNLIQWFAETADSEEELLHSFFSFMDSYRILIHFNGDGFDIPYLLKRCRHFGLDYDFSRITSLDIYKKIKPYRKLLQLDSLKQKSIEHFLGVTRQDKYSGGQLIEVYKDYLVTHESFLYDMLMLHNEDDLKGMPVILPILNYPDFLEQPLQLNSHQILAETDIFGDQHHMLELIFVSKCAIPVPFDISNPPVECHAADHGITFTIDLYEGTLKHFYPNYKDYYYLIYEDTAIHKSIGEYVDRDAREKATARTCYTRQTGCFVPQFSPLWQPEMKQEPKDKIIYAPLDHVCLEDPECVQAYLAQLLCHLGQKTPNRL